MEILFWTNGTSKTILNTVYMKIIFDEMWCIVEYFIMNIFSFLIVFDWKTQDDNNIYTKLLNSAEK